MRLFHTLKLSIVLQILTLLGSIFGSYLPVIESLQSLTNVPLYSHYYQFIKNDQSNKEFNLKCLPEANGTPKGVSPPSEFVIKRKKYDGISTHVTNAKFSSDNLDGFGMYRCELNNKAELDVVYYLPHSSFKINFKKENYNNSMGKKPTCTETYDYAALVKVSVDVKGTGEDSDKSSSPFLTSFNLGNNDFSIVKDTSNIIVFNNLNYSADITIKCSYKITTKNIEGNFDTNQMFTYKYSTETSETKTVHKTYKENSTKIEKTSIIPIIIAFVIIVIALIITAVVIAIIVRVKRRRRIRRELEESGLSASQSGSSSQYFSSSAAGSSSYTSRSKFSKTGSKSGSQSGSKSGSKTGSRTGSKTRSMTESGSRSNSGSKSGTDPTTRKPVKTFQ